MHILHVTPHLPPDQAANALLPWQLGTGRATAGDTVEYVAHPPRAGGAAELAGPGDVGSAAQRDGFVDRTLRLGALIERAAHPARARAGASRAPTSCTCTATGCSPELAVLLARRAGKPVVLTLYGTEIWHYRPKRFGPDLFTRAYSAASIVTFYSERLLARARELGLDAARHGDGLSRRSARSFVWHDAAGAGRGARRARHHQPAPAAQRQAAASARRPARSASKR